MSGDRLDRLRAVAAEAELDAVAVIPGPNLRYFTGLSFHLSERPVVLFVPTHGVARLVAPGFEAGKTEGLGFDVALHTYDDVAGPAAAFEAALSALRSAPKSRKAAAPRKAAPTDAPHDGRAWLGVEGRRMRFLELDLMARSGHGPRVFDADEVFAELRMRKDADEIAAMRRAAAIAEAALAATLPLVRPGVTERSIAHELFVQLLRAGSDIEVPFTPIVASGPNGANPHATPTERALAPGDLVTIDWGAASGGYFSDITRTVAVAGAPVHPELVRAYETVELAARVGRERVRPGATGQDVDRAAREVIDDAGLGAYFTHRTGHGLGLEGHEEPYMREGSHGALEAGMTFTVEPGVYIPGLGGVRIEDDIVVTATGGESLTTLPRDLATVG